MKQRIHIFGASGSGTTTISEAVSKKLGYKHFDTDNYYWYPTKVPFSEKRPVNERLSLMQKDLNGHKIWILSGSLSGWGDPLINLFDLVVFTYVPKDERLERLKKREFERYGNEILPGGSRYESAKEFMEWAYGYDSGEFSGRSLHRHEKWLSGLSCEKLRIVNHSFDESVNAVIAAVNS